MVCTWCCTGKPAPGCSQSTCRALVRWWGLSVTRAGSCRGRAPSSSPPARRGSALVPRYCAPRPPACRRSRCSPPASAAGERRLDLECAPGSRLGFMTTYAPHEVVARSGFSLDTLRYYERIGLLDDVDRTSGGRRVYTGDHLDWLGILHCLRNSGMPVREMRRYAELAREGEATETERLRILQEHRERVLARMAELREALQVVDHKIEYYRREER